MIRGTAERPRLCLSRTHTHIYAQIIDDDSGKTLVAASSAMKVLRPQLKHGGNVKAAVLVGTKLAEVAKAKGVTKVQFDKRWYRYHGRVKAFADAARKGGLAF
jgi:large subunit ribosomal protein L18